MQKHFRERNARTATVNRRKRKNGERKAYECKNEIQVSF